MDATRGAEGELMEMTVIETSISIIAAGPMSPPRHGATLSAVPNKSALAKRLRSKQNRQIEGVQWM
jgi:hypothetical protein